MPFPAAALLALGSMLTALVLTTAACSAGGSEEPKPTVPSGGLESAGPWTDEFRAALDHGVSAFEAEILADGAVTSAEVEAAHDRVDRCLADSGLSIDYDPDGGFELVSLDERYPDGFFERSDPILRACEKESDEYVTYLFAETRRNPERRDDAEITVPCLIAAGLVDNGYTEQQWRDDSDADTLPFDSTSEPARQCDFDPLGLWRDR
ncbi:hypothetical protein EDF64_11730 [Curtobacterium flaccumfaciens]|uniref:DUF732 domain-containing protein n=1 Tax=Curtobacterium flaccumfaciens TaxID=2035 RepID=A0A4R6DBF9_9MICO|nr:hypothetical protein [Curtobacterium flaccumfaciens]TDN41633.1 hypothetical protein EDF64_11730 [Curtobacterium flaccumfaciens]